MEVMKGAEPLSVKAGSSTGVLVIHGFTGSPSEIKPLADALAAAGYDIEAPLLPGHGTGWEDLNQTYRSQWYTSIEEHYDLLKKRCKTVFVGGLSMGGLLSLYLGEKHPEIAGLILINHALRLGAEAELIPFLKNFITSLPKERLGEKKQSFQDGKAKTANYDIIPLKGLDELRHVIQDVEKNLSLIKMPVKIFKSRQDTLPQEILPLTVGAIQSEFIEITRLDHSGHVATADFDKERIGKETISFIKKFTGA